MRFYFNHGFSRISFARVLAHRFAIAYGDLPSETQAFLRRISARFIEMAARPESAPCLLCESGGQGTARPTEMGRALAKAICGLILALALGAVSSAFAATGSSPEFKLDLRGLGPWQRHTAAASEALTYSSAWATNAANGAKAVVKVMPVLKTKPKYLVIDLSGGTNATSYGISYLDEVPGGTWSDEYKTSKLVLRHIPAGSFIMGGRATDYPGAVNTNLHLVTITRDFYMGVFEVTQRQWELVMGDRPSGITNELYYAKRPVEKVSYNDMRGAVLGSEWPKSYAVDDNSFMGVLRKKANLSGLDLPTAAQWEYACRAGTTTGLNSGKNLTALIAPCENLNQVARNAYNSGRLAVTSTGLAEKKYAAADLTYATAWVGMYAANNYGLYDMHGNVYERVLDRGLSSIANSGAVDPVGSKTGVCRLNRGGGWCSTNNWSLTYSFPTSLNLPTDNRMCSDGFRLCLQGGDIPDLASATTLVNESGDGSQSWTPTRSGAYYLTHSTMNGTTNVQLASAWFEVAGCTLTLEPQGELTNGVMIAITGADEGWTVYYTTNGLAPSKASEPYIGPFSLPESGTVRAVAYNEQGVASEEVTTTFTLHDALSVVGAVARQRYPWNGMVDVDVELKGDPEAKYEVEVEARDLDGGTNLPVRTVYVDAFVSNASNKDESSSSDAIETIASTRAIALLPGTHRLTWNADADIAADGEFPRVAVSVKAAGSALIDYSRYFTISTDGYASDETLTNVPVLVRLSTAIDCFDYRDFASPSNGADMTFFDANENELPYEIDEWHTNGESLVWVKLPTLVKGTTFTCAYGHVDAFVSNASDKDGSSSSDAIETIASTERARMKHEVWAEYAGVWHMNEDSGTAYDSTEHGLECVPNNCGDTRVNVDQMIAGEGIVGRGRINQLQWIEYGNSMGIPAYDGLKLGSRFVVSGWFKTTDTTPGWNARLFDRKEVYTSLDGWEIELNKTYGANARGASKDAVKVAIGADFYQGLWVTVVYDGAYVTGYTNGVPTGITGAIAPATDNGGWCLIGDAGFSGQYDEIRLRGGSLSAARIKADYDMIANRKFCIYGAVKKGAE